MGPLLRSVGTWVVATALIVLGVDAAVEQVARDVNVSRPAPMTAREVVALLDVGPTDTATGRGADTDPAGQTIPVTTRPSTSAPTPAGAATTGRSVSATPTSTTPSPGTPGPTATPSTIGGWRPDGTGPTPPGGPGLDVGTTAEQDGSPGAGDGRVTPPRP